MANAAETHGTVFTDGSATLLARVVDAEGGTLTPTDVASIHYSIHLLDPQDVNHQTPVLGHVDVDVTSAGIVQSSLVQDDLWAVDEVGYNFKHVLDITAHAAFAFAGRDYRLVYRIVPDTGQVILVRFRLHAI